MSACVLVVDDYADARELLTILLEDAGYLVVSAAGGEEAVALAREHCPDLVLMDIFMPGMDGISASREIKASPGLDAVPIVAYTARPSVVERLRDLFAVVCKKPSSPAALLQVVHDTLARSA